MLRSSSLVRIGVSLVLSSLLAIPLVSCRRLTKSQQTHVSQTSDGGVSPAESLPDDERLFLNEESLEAVNELGRFSESLEPAWLGKVKVRPDLPPSQENKTQFHEFLTPHQAEDYQLQMIAAVQAFKKGVKPTEGPLAKGMRFERCDKGSTVLPSSSNPDDCAYLITNPKPGQVVQFEFYILGTPGKMRQFIYVTTDILQRPAVFSFNRTLADNVILVYRPDSWQKTILSALLPASQNFDPSQSRYVSEKLLGRVLGFIGTGEPPTDLSDFTLKWEKQQFQKSAILVGTTVAEVALIAITVLPTGGASAGAAVAGTTAGAQSAGGLVGAWQAVGSAAAVIGKEGLSRAGAQSLATHLGWATLQTALVGGSLYAALHLERLREDTDSGPLRTALNTGFMLSQVATLYDTGMFLRNAPNLLRNTRQLLFEEGIRKKVLEMWKGAKNVPVEDRLQYLSLVKTFWKDIAGRNPRVFRNTFSKFDLNAYAEDVKSKSAELLGEIKAMRAGRKAATRPQATATPATE